MNTTWKLVCLDQICSATHELRDFGKLTTSLSLSPLIWG